MRPAKNGWIRKHLSLLSNVKTREQNRRTVAACQKLNVAVDNILASSSSIIVNQLFVNRPKGQIAKLVTFPNLQLCKIYFSKMRFFQKWTKKIPKRRRWKRSRFTGAKAIKNSYRPLTSCSQLLAFLPEARKLNSDDFFSISQTKNIFANIKWILFTNYRLLIIDSSFHKKATENIKLKPFCFSLHANYWNYSFTKKIQIKIV